MIEQSARRANLTYGETEKGSVVLECNKCGQRWYPDIKPHSNGRFYCGWRRCPNGCNADLLRNG